MGAQYNAIGEAAGKIYRTLEKYGPRTASQLQKDTKLSNSALFNQSIGWLAREEKIQFEKSGRTLKFALSNK